MSGTFEILEISASGAMGTVCFAREAGIPDSPVVALKVLKADFVPNANILHRLRDEARMLARLDHPSLLRVNRLLHVGGRPIVEMERVEGVSLNSLISPEKGGLPIGVVCEIVCACALGLEYAYFGSSGAEPMHIIHRDIKPSNILISVRGEVKVADFGLAKGEFNDREAFTEAFVMGSPGYTAPERMVGDPDSPAVDVYSLGVAIFELITGRRLVVSIRKRRHGPAIERQLAFLDVSLSGEVLDRVRGLLGSMCAYEPTLRPTMREVHDGFRGIAVDGGIETDLLAFAREWVAPSAERSAAVAPREHPAYEEIAFIEREIYEEIPTLPDADPRIRAMLRRPNWELGVDDLREILVGPSLWGPEPFLEVLDCALQPRWKFWTRRPSDAQVAQILALLRLQGAAVGVAERARRFRSHGNPEVAKAARRLLGD